MKYIRNDSINPYFNVAFEEYCLENVALDEDYFIIWQNGPSIVIGNNQNVFQEINAYYVNKYNIPIVRRISGGGTVYHDLGNINFTFIFNNNWKNYINYIEHNEKIMEVLLSLGIETAMSKRHDILYKGKKISGNAQKINKKRVLHHGTILFDTDLNLLDKFLKVRMKSIESKAIESIRSEVTNIKNNLDVQLDTNEFKEYLIKSLSNNYKDEEIKIFDEDIINIEKNVNEKYLQWKWNYGESPTFTFKNSIGCNGHVWELDVKVKDGLIFDCKLLKDNENYNLNLVGYRYDITYLIGKIKFIEKEDIMNLFFG